MYGHVSVGGSTVRMLHVGECYFMTESEPDNVSLLRVLAALHAFAWFLFFCNHSKWPCRSNSVGDNDTPRVALG